MERHAVVDVSSFRAVWICEFGDTIQATKGYRLSKDFRFKLNRNLSVPVAVRLIVYQEHPSRADDVAFEVILASNNSTPIKQLI